MGKSSRAEGTEAAEPIMAVWNLPARRLFCEMTLKGGRVSWGWNARAAADYRTLGLACGIRPGIDQIIRPTR